jgi:para-nitrobenzyl esterase
MNPVVETRYGAVRGRTEGDTLTFRAIPFARPPVGPLRWRAPQPPEPWTGELDAAEHGAPAPQRAGELSLVLGLREDGASEDCLTLSVTTPGLAGQRPVLVWIHGGGFTSGAPSLAAYEAAGLAACGDVVVVGVHYRLGALGFAPLLGRRGEPAVPEGEPWANFGMLDILAALEWVRAHAARFGGDPEQVTLFGESAGAMAIGTLLGMPRARGHFGRAILQSGAAESVHGREQAARVAHVFFGLLGVDPADRAALEAVPVDAVLDAQMKTLDAVWRDLPGLTFQPVIDGTLIPELPLAAVETGSARGVALLVGTNRDENRLWSAFNPSHAALDDDKLLRRARVRLRDHAERVTRQYRARVATPAHAWDAIETDRMFGAPAHRLARAHARHGAAFVYRFDWVSPALEGALGACHALEIPFVFGTHRDERLVPLVGSGSSVDALSETMQAAWLAFARRGDPSHGALGDWPRYAAPGHPVQVFGAELRIEERTFAGREALWDDFLGRPGT